jgi:hypothetical protein
MRSAKAKTIMGSSLNVMAFRSLDPFPPTIKRIFKYTALHQLATAASTGYYGTEQRYNLNALYDPDYTGSGHQPYGFDQIMATYNKYRVNRVSYRLSFTTPGAAADMLCAASVAPGTSGSIAAAAPSTPLEWPNCTHGHLSSAGQRLCVLTGTIDLHTLVGVTKQRYDSDDTFVGSVSANPTQLALLSFAVASYSGSASQGVSVLVELEYESVIFDRVNVGPS